MISQYSKKKLVKLSLCLIVVGFIISLIGFGTSGFHTDVFQPDDNPKWYRTITNDEDSFFSVHFSIN